MEGSESPSTTLTVEKLNHRQSIIAASNEPHYVAAISTSNHKSKAMDNLDFLNLSPNGTAFLTVFTPSGLSHTFHGIDLDIISQVCPLLALSFEEGSRGRKLHSLQASSPDLIARFLRFLYTGSYLSYDDEKNEIPCPLLMHVELYRYGYLFEVPHLLDAAHFSIMQTCEYYCCTPQPPEDLCQTISFVYEFLKDQQEVSDTILHYCVNCFVYHKLGENEEFKTLLADLKPFRQDIFRKNMERGFQDEGSWLLLIVTHVTLTHI